MSSVSPARKYICTGYARHRAMLAMVAACLAVWCQDVEARRELLTQTAKDRLQQIEQIHLDALALTDQGATDASAIAAAMTARLADLGYRVTRNATDPHEATLKVKCEEHKTWEGTTPSGGDADAPGGTSRLWRGPACQLSYRLEGLKSDWRHEIRTEAPAGETRAPGAAAAPAATAAAASAPLMLLAKQIGVDPFPLLLTAEWGQSARLLRVLEKPDTAPPDSVRIIGLLGGMAAVDAMPTLARTINHPNLEIAQAAAVAIGTIGQQDGIPLLLSLFKQGRPELHLAAAQGLGRLAPLHPQTDVVPELLAALPTSSIPVQTEIVRALATTADRRSYQTLRELNKDIQIRYSTDTSPDVVALKRALGVAIDQFTNTHSSEEQ